MNASAPLVTFKALGLLLTYPDARLQSALPEIEALLAQERAISPQAMAAVRDLLAYLAEGDALDREEAYVATFDHARACSLHLFEHVHGESRDRGQAMVDLARLYRQAGLRVAANELPDWLPMFLEFCATQPAAAGREHLGEVAHLIGSIHAALARRASPWSAVPAALLELAGVEPTVGPREPAPPADDIDDAWAEPPAFGPCRPAARPGQTAVIQFHRSH